MGLQKVQILLSQVRSLFCTLFRSDSGKSSTSLLNVLIACLTATIRQDPSVVARHSSDGDDLPGNMTKLWALYAGTGEKVVFVVLGGVKGECCSQ